MADISEYKNKTNSWTPINSASLVIGVLGLFYNLFELHIINKFPEIFIGPALYELLRLVIIIVIVILILNSIAYSIRNIQIEKHKSFIPLSINLSSLILILFIPLSNIWPDKLLPPKEIDNNLYRTIFIFKYKDESYADLDVYWDDYNEVIELIEDGELGLQIDDFEIIELPEEYQHLSDDGIILFEKNGEHLKVFFYTFRGVLDNFSGYMYKQDGKTPDSDDFDGDWSQIVEERQNWFFCASQ